jgi:hypothetical protein
MYGECEFSMLRRPHKPITGRVQLALLKRNIEALRIEMSNDGEDERTQGLTITFVSRGRTCANKSSDRSTPGLNGSENRVVTPLIHSDVVGRVVLGPSSTGTCI